MSVICRYQWSVSCTHSEQRKPITEETEQYVVFCYQLFKTSSGHACCSSSTMLCDAHLTTDSKQRAGEKGFCFCFFCWWGHSCFITLWWDSKGNAQFAVLKIMIQPTVFDTWFSMASKRSAEKPVAHTHLHVYCHHVDWKFRLFIK